MEFTNYQIAAAKTDQTPLTGDQDLDLAAMILPMLGLAGEVGSLLTNYKRYIRDGEAYTVSKQRIEEELGDILWNVANIASKLGLDLDAVAARNIKKIQDRWNDSFSSDGNLKLFDENFPVSQRFPREFEIHVVSTSSDTGVSQIELSLNGLPFGNKLTDNSEQEDGYRLHDVFHLTFLALLGWSPVLRGASFFNCKRKDNPLVDEVEDGGRAAVLEEAVAALIFIESQKSSMFKGVGTVEYGLLRTIRELTSHLEVSVVTSKQWELAILKAFELWRELKSAKDGYIRGNLIKREIIFVPISQNFPRSL